MAIRSNFCFLNDLFETWRSYQIVSISDPNVVGVRRFFGTLPCQTDINYFEWIMVVSAICYLSEFNQAYGMSQRLEIRENSVIQHAVRACMLESNIQLHQPIPNGSD